MSRMLIHHHNNILKTSFLMQIRKVVVHSSIVCSQTFRGNIEMEVLILIGDRTHQGYAVSSLRWNCNTDVVVSRLPY